MAFSTSAGYRQAQTSVRIQAPLELRHSSLFTQPDSGAGSPARRLALPMPYSFQFGVM